MKKVKEMSEKPSSLATIRSICDKQGAVKILRCLDRTSEPLKPSEIEKISGVNYDVVISVCNRLSEIGILSLHRTLFDNRKYYYSVKDEDIVKQIFQYDEKQQKQNSERKAALGNGVEEV
jgi:hypothetical protein